MIVLDACRVDALREVAPEYEFIGSIDSTWSVGGTSPEWLLGTFNRDRTNAIEQTGYVTANPHAVTLFEERVRKISTRTDEQSSLVDWDPVSFETFDLYRDISTQTINPYGKTALPELVTEHAVHVGREAAPDRLVVHYMQPHAPYYAGVIERGDELAEHERRPFKALKDNTSRTAVWDAYLDNLRFVLDSVGVLLENYDAEDVVITADHGELFGERSIYSHDAGIPPSTPPKSSVGTDNTCT